MKQYKNDLSMQCEELLYDIKKYYTYQIDIISSYIKDDFKNIYNTKNDLCNSFRIYLKRILNFYDEKNNFINKLNDYNFITIQEYELLKNQNEIFYKIAFNEINDTYDQMFYNRFQKKHKKSML